MIFLPEHVDLIQRGLKWQTRRLVKDGDKAIVEVFSWARFIDVYRPTKAGNLRLLYRAGNTYAICPGRGKLAICRRRLHDIRRERLHHIPPADAIKEGIPEQLEILARFAELWDRIHTKAGTCWADNPEVWVLTFERKP